MSVQNYAELASHLHHPVRVVVYEGANAAIECAECNEVLLDFDNQSPALKMVEHTDAWIPNGGKPECDGKANCPHLRDECGKDNI